MGKLALEKLTADAMDLKKIIRRATGRSREPALARVMAGARERIRHDLPVSDGPASAEGIVFSKNRACQLHALLESYFHLAGHPAPLHILFDAAGRHEKPYEELRRLFSKHGVFFVRQSDFRADLLNLLGAIRAEALFFLVDDIVFTRPFDLHDFCRFPTDTYVPSLRMGANIRRSHTCTRDLPQPEFIARRQAGAETFLIWKWSEGTVDWGFPLSLDGNFFKAAEITAAARHLRFTSPNTFETGLQKLLGLYARRYGVCAEKSTILNIPSNRIQNDYRNMAEGPSAEELLEKWNEGLAIDWRALEGFDNIDPHQPVRYTFIDRGKQGQAP
jgi:hypothetical protein